MFKIATAPTFQAPVNVVIPGGSKGNFMGVFKYLTQTEIEAMAESGRTDREAAREVLLGWIGIQDEAGAVLEFSPEALEILLNIPGFAAATARSFFEECRGAKAKN